MTALSVNVNKIALLRNQRDNDVFDICELARLALEAGADGITVHPRPDERHIRFNDLQDLKAVVTEYRERKKVEFNIEGYPSNDFIDRVITIQPDQVTLVPDLPDAKTSEYGWDVLPNSDVLKDVILRFKAAGIRVSLFLDPDLDQVDAAHDVGADCVEFHTGSYAESYVQGNAQSEVQAYVNVALQARDLGMNVNAGHDLNKENLKLFSNSIPWLNEVSIGHALIADCLEMGIVNCVRAYKGRLRASNVRILKSA